MIIIMGQKLVSLVPKPRVNGNDIDQFSRNALHKNIFKVYIHGKLDHIYVKIIKTTNMIEIYCFITIQGNAKEYI